MPPSTPAEVLDALEQFFGHIQCGASNAGLDMLMDIDLSFSQAKSLLVLSQHQGSIPIHEIAESLRLSVGATGRNVEQLVQHGLVDRQEDDADRRIKRISLTGKGRELIASFQSHQRENVLQFVESLPQEDSDRLLAALRPIIDRFGGPPRSTSAAPPPERPSVALPLSISRQQEQLV